MREWRDSGRQLAKAGLGDAGVGRGVNVERQPRDPLVVAVDQDGGGLTLDGALAGPLGQPTRDVVLDAAAAGEVDRADRREGGRDRGWGRRRSVAGRGKDREDDRG